MWKLKKKGKMKGSLNQNILTQSFKIYIFKIHKNLEDFDNVSIIFIINIKT